MDLRQTRPWSQFMENLGWKTENLDGTNVFIVKMPLIGLSSIKIQHQKAPLPFEKIDQIARQYRALSVIVEPEAEHYDESEYLNHDYERSDYRLCFSANIKIDLRPPLDEIFHSFSENARRNIKKAQANNLLVKKIEMKDQKDWHWFEKFYQLVQYLGQSKKIDLPTHRELLAKMKAFKEYSTIFFAYQAGNNEPIAAVWFACVDNLIAYIQTGINQAGYDQLANYLLVWEGIVMAKNQGIETFDFEGIFDPRYPKDHPRWRNFTEFKKRFHGVDIEYPPTWIKYYNLIFKYIFKWLFWLIRF